jgi:hypothetical protein
MRGFVHYIAPPNTPGGFCAFRVYYLPYELILSRRWFDFFLFSGPIPSLSIFDGSSFDYP